MKTPTEHAEELIEFYFSSEPPTNEYCIPIWEKHHQYVSSPEFEQSKKDEDWMKICNAASFWIDDLCDEVMVEEYEDERQAWIKENPDEDEYDYEYSQEAYRLKEDIARILNHKMYGVPVDFYY